MGQSDQNCQRVKMCRLVTILSMAMLGMFGNTFSMPVVDNPYLSMTINREDLGSSFNMGVDRQNTNLVVSGPPAPSLGFPGSRTYYQPAFGHVQPFLAFRATYP